MSRATAFWKSRSARSESIANPEVYYTIILHAHVQPNASKPLGRHTTAQMDNNPKLTSKATQESKGVFDVLQSQSQSPDLKSNRAAFHLQAKHHKNKQEMKAPKHHQGINQVCADAYSLQTPKDLLQITEYYNFIE